MAYRHEENALDKVQWVLKTLEDVINTTQWPAQSMLAKAQESVATVQELRRLLHATLIGLHPVPSDTRALSRAYIPTPQQRHSNAILAAVHAAGYTEEQTIQELFQAYERLLEEHRNIVARSANPSIVAMFGTKP